MTSFPIWYFYGIEESIQAGRPSTTLEQTRGSMDINLDNYARGRKKDAVDSDRVVSDTVSRYRISGDWQNPPFLDRDFVACQLITPLALSKDSSKDSQFQNTYVLWFDELNDACRIASLFSFSEKELEQFLYKEWLKITIVRHDEF